MKHNLLLFETTDALQSVHYIILYFVLNVDVIVSTWMQW